MNNEFEKNKVGRPFKMQVWVQQLNTVLEADDIISYTDEDLVFLVNRGLPIDSQISKSTFEKWKAGKFHPTEEIGKEFIGMIHLALIRQKAILVNKLMNDTTGQWTRYAWLLERKFAEWNLKHISENINKNEQETIIQITAGSEEQRKLIDSLINTDFVEIKPKQIDSTNNNEDENDLPF
ncbi:hypothetical protein [Flavobacterium muglaense]|uniref:Uncharacterized protein n=1 Tax=Flavobacterium muglaense TaxID=2764716 RepID=A0A923MX26_9FLAO|nr:hypothetical protein [Flavobacterium muglaense]MBC5836786.1 hypothetical protein [Flavobacterium muglaense]MBC5843264.1 hypothetical protein [Flavobacterium muglaense]